MKRLGKTAGRTLNALTKGLDVGQGRKFDNTEGVFQPVSVNRLTENLYSVAHYFEQHGDLVPDPDMTFYRFDQGSGQEPVWVPASFQNQRTYQESMTFDSDGEPKALNPSMQADQASFAGLWMRNIREQQGIKGTKGVQ